jgi:hypothetical protein
MAVIIPDNSVFSTEIATFGDNAQQVWNAGLCPIPCKGTDGKTPNTYKWRPWKNRPGQGFLNKMIAKHSTANIGILTGPLSNVTVVDVDDADVVDVTKERFGDTPLITSTPSGGVHLWYRFNGERCRNLRSEGLDIDIKAIGGFIVVPPSMRPSTGLKYHFERGSFADISALKPINANSLNRGPENVVGIRSIATGRRNDIIFRRLLREVKYTDDIDALMDVARTINEENTETPLPVAELSKIADSAWQYELTGQNWVGQGAKITLLSSEIDLLTPYPNALTFWVAVIHRNHWERTRKPFALATKAMAKSEVIKGWKDWRKYHSAIEDLINLGALKRVHIGKNRGDPHKYQWTLPSPDKGTNLAPNITKHPSAPIVGTIKS